MNKYNPNNKPCMVYTMVYISIYIHYIFIMSLYLNTGWLILGPQKVFHIFRIIE